ncbi:MAG: EsaB/YukD family protein [Synergistaceae bacterium]|jgi:hypothetical protein|nr:EsaB/YukD family protein [Synergistaceae bacterium]
MPEYFIVTVMTASGSFEADLEIPALIPFGEFKAKLLEILKILARSEFGGWSDCIVQYKNRALATGETLAGAGAFDGSRIVVINGTQP